MLRHSASIVALVALVISVSTSAAAPQVFAPGEISGAAAEDCLNLTPDGNTAVYDISNGGNDFIVISHRVGGHWSKPGIAPFSGEWSDGDVALSPDGKYAIYVSNRPATPGGEPTGDSSGALWRVERSGTGWGTPRRLPDTVNPATMSPRSPTIATPSIAADGTLYFMKHGADQQLHIFRSDYRDGHYQEAVQEAVGNPADPQLDPAIAPDRSFIVFSSLAAGAKGPGRLYIAFREGDGWGQATDLGDEVNAGNWPWGEHVSPDGRTLYYVTNRSMPVSYPRSRQQAEQDLARLLEWDDGLSNIWSLSLAPWIEAHKARQGS